MSRVFFRLRHRLLVIVIYFLANGAALATPGANQIAAICDNAAELVARESGVPLDVLRAISLTETGRRKSGEFRPWPWTVNMEGLGKWFDDMGSAQAYVDRHFARGARSFDVGCFQINYKWHGQAFSSIEEMFDPIANARYAARFLSELHNELGDWSKAAGAYHSRTPKYAIKYKKRFDRIRANLPETVPITLASIDIAPDIPTPPQVRTNTYPLLQSGPVLGAASLVPLGTAGTGRFLDVSGARSLFGTP